MDPEEKKTDTEIPEEKAAQIPEEENDEVIADMNVDGMPWYHPERREAIDPKEHYQLSPEEMRTYKFAAVKAALLVVLVFAGVFAAFIAFCQFIWFR